MTVGKTFSVAAVLAAACLCSPAIALAGGVGSVPSPDPTVCACPVGDFWFSTEVGFTSGAFPHIIFPVSDGDLLWESRPYRVRNQRLTQRLGIMPIVPDLGLDAVTFPYQNITTPVLGTSPQRGSATRDFGSRPRSRSGARRLGDCTTAICSRQWAGSFERMRS